LLQSPFKDSIWDWGLGGSLCRQIIIYCVLCTRDVVQVQDFEILF
jgi:hypothetical protein